jgi:hypothetical protein
VEIDVAECSCVCLSQQFSAVLASAPNFESECWCRVDVGGEFDFFGM